MPFSSYPRVLLLVVVACCVCGCQQKAVTMADPDRAEAALRRVLDAWKAGQTPESLKTQAEPVHVSDSEWLGGARLVDYEVTSSQSAGFGWRCDVRLTIQSPSGATRKHMALYRIDTDPAIVVVHEE
ncbi:hypothetical protein KOR34_18070 [Posidoniimonas corsicana]|uniref:Uncharacterized protein n=1 Tax=Posidoniimonas corsicana TaxID=1938618 RepID=A0A5C5VGT7_9BACT|nr:hypothetical protein [Posidoniimonas corsicana]TWT36862.1 hypothetical protein KOR34_18070 [Posidoniimonas corsicana]